MTARIHALRPKRPDARDDFDALREVWKHEPLEQEPFEYPLWWKVVVIFDLGLAVVICLFALARYMSQ